MEMAGIRFLDSYNFLLFAPSKMHSAFRFQESKKGFFPHFFNTEANQHYVGPFPSPDFYNPDDMSASDRQVFSTWYEQQRDRVFDFQHGFQAYYISWTF